MASTLKTQLKSARKNSGFSVDNGILSYSGTAEEFSSAIKSKLKADPTIDGQISLTNAANELVVITIKQGVIQGKKAKVAKDPNAPKRPPTSYFIFLTENRENIKAKNPEAKVTEIARIAGQQWKALTPAQKKPYEDKNVDAKAQYEKDVAAYKATGGVASTSTEEATAPAEAPAPKKSKKSTKATAPAVEEAPTPKKTKKSTKATAPVVEAETVVSAEAVAPKKKVTKKTPKA